MRFPLMMLLQLAGGVTGVIQRIVLAWRLFRDGRVPLLPKAIPAAGVAYAVSPLDVIPDWLIGPGHIDDVVVAFLGVWFFVAALSPPARRRAPARDVRLAAPQRRRWRGRGEQIRWRGRGRRSPRCRAVRAAARSGRRAGRSDSGTASPRTGLGQQSETGG